MLLELEGNYWSTLHNLDAMPTSEQLRTPIHFTSSELDIFKGTNLYGAALNRDRLWKTEWTAFIANANAIWANIFSCKYLWRNSTKSTAHSGSHQGHNCAPSVLQLKVDSRMKLKATLLLNQPLVSWGRMKHIKTIYAIRNTGYRNCNVNSE